MKWTNIELGYENKLDLLKKKSSYELLGITQEASLKEIKKAYKKKVLLYHPDRTDDFMTSYSEEVIKLLNKAVDKIKENIKNES
ncbi:MULTISPECIES: DnaJ domain-containing protein [unclassified Colwellia]|jgi:curved DNA-binding protein CbpA|uniref:DnaJ domain-containing protein n=1 Tax=unclassified Colwellia TaxID=196834 RepID=UPI0015F4E967|nr:MULTISPECIES: DnaJ domain-containing protein [unclassified Colwellia]MBA6379692.1 DnaJ domain-containing protein [Colwellia sp. BRX10-7]MBA6388493.1 DnaJ domain-containing protein [Colwellia sp. BRX10-2]MBA6402993.1 DnaJ domain-containing protein [Colwellia sp. BRX10-5]MBA6406310.1 DnaJ domain-containing protein [Colwellia sp. BRX10-1]